MSNKRFHTVVFGIRRDDDFDPRSVVVADVSREEIGKVNDSDREKHVLARFKIGGMISPRLAQTWADQVAEQLNQFDTANAAVAKMS